MSFCAHLCLTATDRVTSCLNHNRVHAAVRETRAGPPPPSFFPGKQTSSNSDLPDCPINPNPLVLRQGTRSGGAAGRGCTAQRGQGQGQEREPEQNQEQGVGQKWEQEWEWEQGWEWE